MVFDRTKLTDKDYTDLSKAVSKAAPKVRFWYHLPNTFFLEGPYNLDRQEYPKLHFINLDEIAKLTGATTDYDKLHKDHKFMTQDRYNSIRIRIGNASKRGFQLRKLLGLRDVDICVFNPQNSLPNVPAGRRIAELVQIDGLGFGNTYDARVNLEKGIACFNEEDQDIAHKLGLEYFPTGIMEIDSLRPSDHLLHSKKTGQTNDGKPIIYCDNPACCGELRAPEIVIDPITGGAYHGITCFWKDIGIKRYLARERKEIDLSKVEPVRVPLTQALVMYADGALQQSRENRKLDPKSFRQIEMWPEAAILFPF